MHNSLSYLLIDSPSITRLLFYLEEKRYGENEVIMVQGMPFQNLIYLHKGGVSLKCIYGKKLFPLKELEVNLSLYRKMIVFSTFLSSL